MTLGYALGSGFAPSILGPKAARGAKPKVSFTADGEAEPRLTSGGGAGTKDE